MAVPQRTPKSGFIRAVVQDKAYHWSPHLNLTVPLHPGFLSLKQARTGFAALPRYLYKNVTFSLTFWVPHRSSSFFLVVINPAVTILRWSCSCFPREQQALLLQKHGWCFQQPLWRADINTTCLVSDPWTEWWIFCGHSKVVQIRWSHFCQYDVLLIQEAARTSVVYEELWPLHPKEKSHPSLKCE